ncbi:MAG: hypothetical protein IIB45_10570 [Candidatus Marinimicrobia bacterium]|nr:hypothetical protein [Candidatus Neomarinimicrobiota bacterium]
MIEIKSKFSLDRPQLLEVFVLFNLAFLSLDVFIAHSINAFHHWAEWIPFYFSIVTAILLTGSFLYYRSNVFRTGAGRLGSVVGWTSIFVGIYGMILHLDSQFFIKMTLQSLVYTAPFVAPLSFAGLGFLLLLNRQVDSESNDWGRWIVFFAWGGFVGNFLLSLADHAQNGFFYLQEWIAVVSSALAVGFLFTVIIISVNRFFLKLCFWIIGIQVIVGLLGFYFHLVSDFQGPASSFMDNLIYGAPIFAPLLFPNLAILAAIGLWDILDKTIEPIYEVS